MLCVMDQESNNAVHDINIMTNSCIVISHRFSKHKKK